MKSELLAKSPMLALPLGALFFFLFVFCAVVFLTMRRKTYAAEAALALEGDEGPRATPPASDTNATTTLDPNAQDARSPETGR